MTHQRVLGFDLLRGICSVGVAFYHVLFYLDLAKLYSIGQYGVYIFFVLSGASIYIAYAERIRAGYDLRKFIAQRFFRLAPLFALVILVAPYIREATFELYKLDYLKTAILNISFAFGLGNPGQLSLVTGAWSLGIEFVFYLIFPVILAFVSGGVLSNIVLLAAVACSQALFVHSQITGAGMLVERWVTYTQFLAFAAYFVAGCVIGRVVLTSKLNTQSIRWQVSLWGVFLLLSASITFSSQPVQDLSLMGGLGFALPVMSIALVLVAGFLHLPRKLKFIGVALGNMSYGLYLLHPHVYSGINRHFHEFVFERKEIVAPLIVFAAAILALFIERIFERPIRDFGKRILSRTACSAASAGLHRPADIIGKARNA